MAQRPSLDADSLHGSGIINLSRVSKFRAGPDGSRTSNSDQGFAQPGAVPAPANADAADSGGSHSNSAAGQPGRIEVAAEHAAAAGADAAQRHAARESSPGSEAVLAARQAAATVEPPEWFIRWACNTKLASGMLLTPSCWSPTQPLSRVLSWRFTCSAATATCPAVIASFFRAQGPDEGAAARIGPAAVQLRPAVPRARCSTSPAPNGSAQAAKRSCSQC
jgi:hypothetical protein